MCQMAASPALPLPLTTIAPRVWTHASSARRAYDNAAHIAETVLPQRDSAARLCEHRRRVHELEVLRSWPLSRTAWCVNVFTVENNHWCNRTEGILPQIAQILGAEYKHVRSLGVDELFVRKTPCRHAAVPLKAPPYHIPRYVDPRAPSSRQQRAGGPFARPVQLKTYGRSSADRTGESSSVSRWFRGLL